MDIWVLCNAERSDLQDLSGKGILHHVIDIAHDGETFGHSLVELPEFVHTKRAKGYIPEMATMRAGADYPDARAAVTLEQMQREQVGRIELERTKIPGRNKRL